MLKTKNGNSNDMMKNMTKKRSILLESTEASSEEDISKSLIFLNKGRVET